MLRELCEEDIPLINAWPPYCPQYAEMDRYLRDGGLPEQYYRDPRTRVFAAVAGESDIIGFTALIEVDRTHAEFVVFIRDDAIGKGLRERTSRLTLREAFRVYGYDKLSLVVRRHKRKEKALYEKLGFRVVGACCREIDGAKVPFHRMALHKREYDRCLTKDAAPDPPQEDR